jgi:hypothetical protein
MANLLTTRYDDMDLAQRVNAIEEAYRMGSESAQADMGAAGGIDTRQGGAREYFRYVVEPLYAAEDCSEDMLTFFESAEDEGDPRIEAFGRGWLQRVLEAEQEIAEEAEAQAGYPGNA